MAGRLTLASASPQRRAILTQVGIPFDVRPTGVEEETEGEPAALARLDARRKAEAVAGSLVLGVDTVVALDGVPIGKPRDAAHAREVLGSLAGRTHEVIGGFALADGGGVILAGDEITRVTFRPATDALLDWYVATGEWQDRAGGYAIQGAGAVLVSAIEGDYLNVVGLPLARLLDLRPDLLEGSDPSSLRGEPPAGLWRGR